MGFQRRQEDFTCEHCATVTKGTGYTNHCPSCLWSKHVDNDPGDRANPCHGLMLPIIIEYAGHDRWRIVHRCLTCRLEKKNDVQAIDDWDAVIAVQKKAFGTK
jgi:hypothetical protein